jgi:hypothetical protein
MENYAIFKFKSTGNILKKVFPYELLNDLSKHLQNAGIKCSKIKSIGFGLQFLCNVSERKVRVGVIPPVLYENAENKLCVCCCNFAPWWKRVFLKQMSPRQENHVITITAIVKEFMDKDLRVDNINWMDFEHWRASF